MPDLMITELTDRHRAWALELIADRWGSPLIVTRGRVHDTSSLPGLVAVRGGEPIGLLTYHIEGEACEITSLDSLREGAGVGSVLVEAVKEQARRVGCKRLWLITTNDNLKAVRFYQKRGFGLVAVHRNALEHSRRLKPSIPLEGIDGIPLRDEIELELELTQG